LRARVLIVEDNKQLAYGLHQNLEIEGYAVEVVADGRTGLEQASSGDHDLIVLDLTLPEMDGLKVLRTLRAREVSTPVLILTARGDEADKVRGLRMGADDYLTKPFALLELLARVEALLRRTRTQAIGSTTPAERESFGAIEVHRPARAVTVDREPVELAPKEFDLLVALLDRRGHAVSREELLRDVWGRTSAEPTRTVDTHIAELRRKLEPLPSAPRHILTVRKVGYRLQR